MLIHGLWMTALSWEHWVERYEDRGFNVIARSWPGMDGDIDELRRDPSGIEHLGIEEIVDYYAGIIGELDSPPIIMGHSFGGAFTQILLDRGLGAAGVAIDSGPVKGLLALPASTLKTGFPVLKNPANNHRAVPLTPEEFHYAFTNTLSDEESLAVYERYAVPGPGRVLFQGAFANFNPHSPAAVDFKNSSRAPLLFIAGGDDHVAPASLNEVEPQALPQVGRDHRAQGVPRPLALHARPGGLGGSRRLRARLGREPRGRSRGGLRLEPEPQQPEGVIMDLKLADKVAVVTGANKGIGFAVTQALLAEGAYVVAGSLSTENLDDLDRVVAVPVNLVAANGPALLVQRAVDEHGRLDVLVNNVGAVRIRTEGFLGTSDEEFEWALQMPPGLAPRRAFSRPR